MRNATRIVWRRYRALPGRARFAIVVVVVVTIVIASAVGGSARKAPSTVGPAAAVTSTTGASMATPAASTSPAPSAPLAPVTASSVGATTPTTAAVAPSDGPSACHVRGTGLYVLPDPTCTPGVTNPGVTQANIASTICASGWTATIRPPESYTEPLKMQQMGAYAETGPIGSYEEDHLISLELGGSPTDPRNLWPEPGASPNPKDSVENAARRAVCDGQMSLASAQQEIAGNWISLGQQLGFTVTTVPGPTPATSETTPPTTPSTSSYPAPRPGVCSPRTSGGNC